MGIDHVGGGVVAIDEDVVALDGAHTFLNVGFRCRWVRLEQRLR